MLAILASFACAFLPDLRASSDAGPFIIPGYAALISHAITTLFFDHTQQVLSESLGQSTALAAATLGSTVVGLPFYLFRALVVCVPTIMIVVMKSSNAYCIFCSSQMRKSPNSHYFPFCLSHSSPWACYFLLLRLAHTWPRRFHQHRAYCLGPSGNA